MSVKQIGHQLVQVIKQCDFSAGSARELRAVTVAQAIAYTVPLDPNQPSESAAETHMPMLKSVVSEVNEALPLDVNLVQGVFRRLLAGRYVLMNGLGDPVWIAAALGSPSQDNQLDSELIAATRALLDKRQIRDAQAEIQALIGDLFTPESDPATAVENQGDDDEEAVHES